MSSVLTPLLRLVRTCAPWVLAVVMCLSAVGLHEHLHAEADTVAACAEHDHDGNNDEATCDLADCACPAPAALLPAAELPSISTLWRPLGYRLTDLIAPPNPGYCPDPPPAQRT